MANPLTRSLASLFRSKADLTSLKRLKQEGIRTVNVLDLSKLEDLVGEAIERVLRDAAADGSSPHQLAQSAQLELMKLLGNDGRLRDKGDELARERHHLEQNLGALEATLAATKGELKTRTAEAERASMVELRSLLDESLREAFERASAELAASAPGAAPAFAALEQPLRESMLSLLAAALKRSSPTGESSSEAAKVELLERRVQKLTATLEETQALLERLRAEKSATASDAAPRLVEPPAADGSGHRTEQRRALLREIFEHNVDLRRMIGNPE